MLVAVVDVGVATENRWFIYERARPAGRTSRRRQSTATIFPDRRQSAVCVPLVRRAWTLRVLRGRTLTPEISLPASCSIYSVSIVALHTFYMDLYSPSCCSKKARENMRIYNKRKRKAKEKQKVVIASVHIASYFLQCTS